LDFTLYTIQAARKKLHSLFIRLSLVKNLRRYSVFKDLFDAFIGHFAFAPFIYNSNARFSPRIVIIDGFHFIVNTEI
jgi:hypothetical protein